MTSLELRDQRKRAHEVAVAALGSHEKETFTKAMADVDRLGAEIDKMEARGNIYESVTGTEAQTGMAFEPPYSYMAEATSDLAERITREAGPH